MRILLLIIAIGLMTACSEIVYQTKIDDSWKSSRFYQVCSEIAENSSVANRAIFNKCVDQQTPKYSGCIKAKAKLDKDDQAYVVNCVKPEDYCSNGNKLMWGRGEYQLCVQYIEFKHRGYL